MYIGIDLGGTNIAAALVDGCNKIIAERKTSTDSTGGAAIIAEQLIKICNQLKQTIPSGTLKGIGLGVPGIVDQTGGTVIFTPNLPISGYDIAEILKTEFGCNITLGNDSDCFTLGESTFGAAKNANNAVCLTLGTGIGGGIIINNRLYRGSNGTAGEFGHMTIIENGRKCGCGRRGCWERYASAAGLIETTAELMENYPNSAVFSASGGIGAKMNGEMVFDAAQKGDSHAVHAISLYIKHLAVGLVNIINILQPELICIGGGITEAWDYIVSPLCAAVESEKITRFSHNLKQTQIVKSALRDKAAVIGAAMLPIFKT